MSTVLYDPIKTMSKITDSVIVGFSTGKESLVVLDLCKKYFKNVYAYFRYAVPNLSFQEKTLSWYENKYNIEILRLPGTSVCEFFHYGTFRPSDDTFPIISDTDLLNYVRIKSGYWWVANGERIDDSLQRRAMIKHSGTIYEKGGRFYPVAMWKKREIYDYIKFKHLYLGPDSRELGYSMRLLTPKGLSFVYDKYPEDFEKVIKLYPLAEAMVKREKEYGQK